MLAAKNKNKIIITGPIFICLLCEFIYCMYTCLKTETILLPILYLARSRFLGGRMMIYRLPFQYFSFNWITLRPFLNWYTHTGFKITVHLRSNTDPFNYRIKGPRKQSRGYITNVALNQHWSNFTRVYHFVQSKLKRYLMQEFWHTSPFWKSYSSVCIWKCNKRLSVWPILCFIELISMFVKSTYFIHQYIFFNKFIQWRIFFNAWSSGFTQLCILQVEY